MRPIWVRVKPGWCTSAQLKGWYEVNMNIRMKMLSVLALLFAVLILLEIAIQKQVLMPSFVELERDDAKTSMTRIDNALDTARYNLQLSAADWGNWGELYQFVQGHNAEFVKMNVTKATLKQLQVDMVMIVDLTGQVLVSSARDLSSGELMNLDFAAQKALPENFPWRSRLTQGNAANGLISTNQGVMMLAGAPILDGSGGGLWKGMAIMGRLLTPGQVLSIATQAQARLSMIPNRSAEDRLVETSALTQVYRSFADIYGHPVMTLRVDLPRKITAHGQRAVVYASAYLIVAGVAALLLLMVVVNRVVLAPLGRMTRHAVALGKGTDLTARLDLPGHDEVAVLAREFDRMLGRVADSQRQLMDQSYQAGFAELAKGVLHNLGNAMTPLGVRLSKLRERLRDAPSADVERAFEEFTREEPGSDRYADLQAFLRLGHRELSAALNDAQENVIVIERQTAVAQSALSELMRSTRNEHVIESVRLPELISQTLDIVPDVCRQRLAVDADESLQRVGVVQVARTVLRLVLQNFIINAADAVRDAGRERGVFKVVAEIVHASDREQLHLCCEDDGAGIAQANLERVFDKGFSTKSRDTNYGIGLHWCANAIAALGGRIWAASDGPGCGASMHLMLPLPRRVETSS
jgi:two-component system, NtrC family, sensor kinase